MLEDSASYADDNTLHGGMEIVGTSKWHFEKYPRQVILAY